MALCVLAASHSYGLTVDELARYLGVTSISTTVALPSESFTTEIWTIDDGAPGKRLISGIPARNRYPERGLTIMIGDENGKYKVVLAYGGGVTMNTLTSIPIFKTTVSGDFPKSIVEGDFPLFGEPKSANGGSSREISTFQQGFLLRIKKNG